MMSSKMFTGVPPGQTATAAPPAGGPRRGEVGGPPPGGDGPKERQQARPRRGRARSETAAAVSHGLLLLGVVAGLDGAAQGAVRLLLLVLHLDLAVVDADLVGRQGHAVVRAALGEGGDVQLLQGDLPVLLLL